MSEPNQHESVERAARYARHVTELAARFGVRLRVYRSSKTEGKRPHDAAALLARSSGTENMDECEKIVRVPVVSEDTSYATALHEMGHLLHPLGLVHRRDGSLHYRKTDMPVDLRDVRLLMLAERSAWEWARQFAMDWTPAMDYVARLAFNAYRQKAAGFGHKEAPLW